MTPRRPGEGSTTLEEEVRRALEEVRDPEIPSVSIVDLGLVEDVRVEEGGRVAVDLLPTFTGCPALGFIKEDAAAAVSAVPGVNGVSVRFLMSPAWSTDRITPEGRRRLTEFGIAPPEPLLAAAGAGAFAGGRGGPAAGGPASPGRARPARGVACPYCGSEETVFESAFGPTRCRTIYYCRACRNPFEKMKEV